MSSASDDGSELARAIVQALTDRGQTLSVAESLTGGLLASAIVDVPGASVVLRGGVVAYATDLKVQLLGVDEGLVARVGPVHVEVAAAMAKGARTRLGATYGLATTGVAGPDPQDGYPPGTVCLGLALADCEIGQSRTFPGDRAAVRAGAVRAALALLADSIGVN